MWHESTTNIGTRITTIEDVSPGVYGKFKLFRDIRIARAIQKVYPNDDVPEELMDNMSFTYFKMIRDCTSGGLLELILASHYFETTNPLDRVYALLGLLPPEKAYIQPDYNQSFSQLCIDVIAKGVHASGSLVYISAGGVGLRSDEDEHKSNAVLDLPSWVPEFSKRLSPVYWTYQSLPHMDLFDASRGLTKDYQFSSDGRALRALGLVCDEVIWVTTAARSIIEYNDEGLDVSERGLLLALELEKHVIETLKRCLLILKPGKRHASSVPWLQALLRTLVPKISYINTGLDGFHCSVCEIQYTKVMIGFLSIMHDILDMERNPNYGSEYNPDGSAVDYRQFPWNDFLGPDQLVDKSTWSNAEIWDGIDHEECRGYLCMSFNILLTEHFFVTEDGYYGLSEGRVKEGDKVCIIGGCPVPLLVRQVGHSFVVVSDCHIYGAMMGELVEKMEKKDSIPSYIQLR